jgi:hypothetical protein
MSNVTHILTVYIPMRVEDIGSRSVNSREVSLFESEIEIEMKRHKIISIIEIEIQLK